MLHLLLVPHTHTMAATSSSILSYKDFDPKLLKTEQKPAKQGKILVVKVTYDGKPLIMRFPKLLALSSKLSSDEPVGSRKVNLNLRIPKGPDNAPDPDDEVVRVLNAVDTAILEYGLQCDWYPKPKPDTVEKARVMHWPCVKPSDDPEKFNPIFRVGAYLDKDGGALECACFAEDRSAMKVTDVSDLKLRELGVVAELANVWIKGKEFGTAWRVKNLRVYDRKGGRAAAGGASKLLDAIAPGELDPVGVGMGPPKAISPDLSMSFLTYGGGNSTLIMTLPPLRAPFGMSVPQGKFDKYSIELEVPESAETRSLTDALTALSSRVRKEGLDRDWFKGAVFKPIIKPGRDSYPAMFGVKIPHDRRTGELQVEVVHRATGERIPREELEAELHGARVEAVVECSGIWHQVEQGSYGISFRMLKMTVEPKSDQLSACVLGDDELDEGGECDGTIPGGAFTDGDVENVDAD
jgi:hypothetical protein